MTVLVRGLRKSFRHLTKRTEVLKGVDLEVAPGEVVGLIGPNGAGKTTLMSCLLAFLRVDEGVITIDGRRSDDLAIRRRTGFVPERMNFDRHVTARRFLRYMARLAGIPRRDVDARVSEMMQRLGVEHGADKKLSQHSRGMLQRVGMCQALINDPAYLFLDEPASGLDPNGVILVRDIILEQKRRGAAILLNSHQLSEVEKVCDRVFFLSRGVIARQERIRGGDVNAVITMLPGSFDPVLIASAVEVEPLENVVTVAVDGDEQLAEVVRKIVATGAGIVEVRRQAADLEQMFRGAQ